jgi:hypothetical protein
LVLNNDVLACLPADLLEELFLMRTQLANCENQNRTEQRICQQLNEAEQQQTRKRNQYIIQYSDIQYK